MAKIVNAVDVVVTFKLPDATDEVILGCAQSFSFTKSRAMDPSTCSASGKYSQVTPGRFAPSTGSISALYREPEDDDEAGLYFDDIDDMIEDGTEVTVSYAKKVGGKRYQGKAFVNNLTYTVPEDGNVTWSADLTFNGKISRVTQAFSTANQAILASED